MSPEGPTTEAPFDFDLDAEKAARRETAGEAYVFKWAGQAFTLPPEAPWGWVAAIFGGQSEQEAAFYGMRGLLGEDYDRFIATRPDIQTVQALSAHAMKLYGLGRKLGESPASEDSSDASSSPSRPTSSGSTDSTSAKSSGENDQPAPGESEA